MKRRREKMHASLYTIPLTPVAGQPVDVYYNPDLTVLRGACWVLLSSHQTV